MCSLILLSPAFQRTYQKENLLPRGVPSGAGLAIHTVKHQNAKTEVPLEKSQRHLLPNKQKF
jgi:hypothetical protein